MIRSNFKKQRGFTLVETLVAIVILTVALIPLLNLATSTFRVNATLEDNLVASGLAQEGVEVIHAIRDTNWFNNLAFDSGLADGTYRVEWNSTSLLSLGTNPVLKLNNGLYNYSAGVASKFSRTVTISKINAGEIKVISQVSWLDRSGGAKTISIEDHLFNWR